MKDKVLHIFLFNFLKNVKRKSLYAHNNSIHYVVNFSILKRIERNFIVNLNSLKVFILYTQTFACFIRSINLDSNQIRFHYINGRYNIKEILEKC